MSKTAFIFPGQGAQKIGMGKDFYENSQIAASIYDKASELLNIDLKALCFESNDRLNQTEYTQVALVATCISMAKVLEERGIVPDVTAGLSLGEYCALVVAGGMRWEDAVTTVRKRGILMQDAVPEGKGAMSAVLGLEAGVIETVLADIQGVSIANYNCPGQIVVTGLKEGVEQASGALSGVGAKRVLPLNVSGPFHSPFMAEAGRELGKILEKLELNTLALPYVTNVTGEYVEDIKKTKELLITQVASSVLWQQSVERMIEQGVDIFVEIGPGKTLAGFMRKINKNVRVYNVETWEDIEKVVDVLC